MLCKNCGKEMKDSAVYCPECGTKAERSVTENTSSSNTETDLVSIDSTAKAKKRI